MFFRQLMLFASLFIPKAMANTKAFTFGLPNAKSRPAIIYTPHSAKTGPLLVVLHGGSRNAELAMNQDSEGEWNLLAEKYGWVVLYPSGTVNQKDKKKLLWNDCRASFGDFAPENLAENDVTYLDALISEVLRTEKLSQDAIFLTGHSNGGGMVFRMAMESTLPLRAINPMLMTLPRNLKRCQDRWNRPIPTAYVLGTADPMVNFKGGNKGRSASETLEWIRQKNIATELKGTSELRDSILDDGLAGSSSTIVRSEYGAKAQNANVLFFEVKGGGHQIPGPASVEKWVIEWLGPKNRDISLRSEVAKFFVQTLERK